MGLSRWNIPQELVDCTQTKDVLAFNEVCFLILLLQLSAPLGFSWLLTAFIIPASHASSNCYTQRAPRTFFIILPSKLRSGQPTTSRCPQDIITTHFTLTLPTMRVYVEVGRIRLSSLPSCEHSICLPTTRISKNWTVIP